ncbi:MAG: molybdate ABC transporter substrate-binding protein [Polyangiaceae bacterium]
MLAPRPASPGVARRAALLALASALGMAAISCAKEPSAAPADAGPAEIQVAAASDLAVALKEIGEAYQKAHGSKVVITFGSTGLLAKQIAEGARYDAFFAANVSFVDDVVRAGACDGATKAPYARGRIVIWSKDGIADPAPATLADLKEARFAKLAIANPEHAPYGKAAQQALQSAGLWEAVKPRLVYAENIQQTLQFAQTGNAEAAIVALSLAMVTEGGKWSLIDDAGHKPIDQVLVVCNRGDNRAGGAAFATFVGAEGRETMRRFGFVLPGEPTAVKP